MKNEHIPYYYIIGWTEHDRWYVGCRYAKKCHPSDLMVTYFTSSPNYVAPFIEQHGLPDVVWTFPCKTREEAIAGELRIMSEFHNFLPDERWLNKNIGGAILMDEEVISKKAAALKGKTPWNKGRKMTDEQRAELISARARAPSKLKGERLSCDHKAKISAALKGRERSLEHKTNISASKKGKPSPNKGNGRKHTLNGEEYTINELSELYHIKPNTIHARLRKGLSVASAISTPIKEKNK